MTQPGVKLILIVAVLLLSACSSTTFVYNRLDVIAPWYVDDYVELDSAQDQQLDALLEPFLAWHRLEELPRYIELLAGMEATLDQSISAADLAAVYDEAVRAWVRLQDQSLSWMLELGAGLSDQQMADFIANLQERQEEFEEEYLPRSDAKFRSESYDSFLDSMQDYLGRLDREQRNRLREASASLKRSDGIWLEERAVWLERLSLMLQRQPGWQQQVREAIDKRGETTSARYQETFDHNLAVVLNAVADVLNSRTDKQDRRLRAELLDLREDLETLVAQGQARSIQ